MSIARLRFMAVALALVGSGLAVSLLRAQQSNVPWAVGYVFVAIGNGSYEVRDRNGDLKQTIQSSINPKKEVAGCGFDGQFNVLFADYYNTKVGKFNFLLPHDKSVFADTGDQDGAPGGKSTAISFAANSDVYVAHALASPAAVELLRYNRDGGDTPVASYTPNVEPGGGINAIDLAINSRRVWYTSGAKIKQFDVGTTPTEAGAQVTENFATLSTGQANAIRLLGPSFDGTHGLIVAAGNTIQQLDSSGGLVASYDTANANDENSFFALNLDPDGLHFWAGGLATGKLYRFALGTSTPDITKPTAAAANQLRGLCVAGAHQNQVSPIFHPASTSATLMNVTTAFGDPATELNSNAYYSYNTYRLRAKVKANQPAILAAVGFNAESSNNFCRSVKGKPDPNDFDCRFTQAQTPTATQCEPFFKDPTPRDPNDPNELNAYSPYRCVYYRLEGMPDCSANCPFDEPLIPGTTSVSGDIIINLTDPNPLPAGYTLLGNPHIMRAPGHQFQFFVDATTGINGWPVDGTGWPNDYAPVQRELINLGGCGKFISPPNNSGSNLGSNMKLIIELKKFTDSNGNCYGDPIEGASTPPNNITILIHGGPGGNVNAILCETPGNSLGCFTPVNGQPGRYQSTFDLLPSVFSPTSDSVTPPAAFIFSVTSVAKPTESPNPADQPPGLFQRFFNSYYICSNGSNCGG
jgi:hypothetical protein